MTVTAMSGLFGSNLSGAPVGAAIAVDVNSGVPLFTDSNGKLVNINGAMFTGQARVTSANVGYPAGTTMTVMQGEIQSASSAATGAVGGSTGVVPKAGPVISPIGGSTSMPVSTPVSSPTNSSDCPCTTTTQPFDLYLSPTQTPNSQTVHGTRKKTVCVPQPDGTPSIPCDELNTAVQKIAGTSATSASTGTGTTSNSNPTSMNGLARDAVGSIMSKPVSSAIEVAAGVALALYAAKRFRLGMAATIAVGAVGMLGAGKITDNYLTV